MGKFLNKILVICKLCMECVSDFRHIVTGGASVGVLFRTGEKSQYTESAACSFFSAVHAVVGSIYFSTA